MDCFRIIGQQKGQIAMTNQFVMLVTALVAVAMVDGSARTCREITIPACRGIGYNTTDTLNQKEAELEVQQFSPFIKIECSPDLQLLVCSVYAPICRENYTTPLSVCRSVCTRARDGCSPLMQAFGFTWPTRLNCDVLPVDGEDQLCVDRNGVDHIVTY